MQHCCKKVYICAQLKILMMKYTLLFLFCGSLLITSCKKEDPFIPNEEELITTLRLTLTDGNGGEAIFSFRDLGDGQAPEIVEGVLKANTIYDGVLELLDESTTEVGDITAEVIEEADEHQVFYISNNGAIMIDYSDQDVNGYPLGIVTKLTTTDTGNSELKVILRHEPAKAALNVQNGDITNAGGETDIEVTFNVVIE